jgi:3-phosphoshikimate 1-carboxyvinyltransferase
MVPDPYPVKPWTRPCTGSVRMPGSKSLTNRALVMAALSDGPACLEGALFSRDTRIMSTILRELGFKVELHPGEERIEIEGLGGRIPASGGSFHVGNAGTAARFLTAFVCLHPDGHYHFDGDEEMRTRPMLGLIEALQRQGARFTFHGEEGCFPFEVRTSGLRGGAWEVDARASSQMLSALMMVAPLAREPVKIDCPNVRPAFVNMTAGIMRQWGGIIAGTPSEGYELRGSQCYSLPGGVFEIEPAVTAASYFMMLPRVVGDPLELTGFINIHQTPDGWRISAEPTSPGEHRFYDFKLFSDTFLTLAAVAPLLSNPVTITGIGHTRFQETDRIKAMATELERAGARVEEHEASLTVHPFGEGGGPPGPVTIETYKDHRMAMSFAVLGCARGSAGDAPWIRIADPGCCGKTFPRFFEELERLYLNSHDK